ncbi:hypothetical protein NLI96_g12994 [Meripilus lineatus]|uniref:Uncharacterized protein n=1 Tax=Meripilus lineatus TaxID=2056292 RepID=A0AAD5UP46_9APHY|nr:hypothetical protein NLI96_g12994 [Physisporinus lineatus]
MGGTDNAAGPSQVQQVPDTETEPQPRFQLRATGRSLVDSPVRQTRSDNAPRVDFSNLRANLRRVGNEVGNENQVVSSGSRKGKGVVRPPLRSLNGPRDGSA